MNNNYCVIMAGGVGSRFWPLSRNAKPKQFLDIQGIGRTLLQQTFDRFVQICPKENIYIVSNAEYEALIKEQLPDLGNDQILLEPGRRNTAPCIAYANFKIQTKSPDANIIVAPSDHTISKEMEFISVIKKGLKFVDENNYLLTLGITPSRPDTGYGYIQINNTKGVKGFSEIKKVKTFTEKPNAELAKVFVESGEFFWNSGIFLWSLKSIDKAFKQYLPEVYNLFAEGFGYYNTPNEAKFIKDTYAECKNISIDYGIMEKAENVYVYCADFGWSDLGTWGSLYDLSDKNEAGNSIIGKNVMTYNTSNCIVKVPEEKLVVLHGLDNYIVVESDDALLICKKDDEQLIRQFVNDVKLSKGNGYI